MSWKALGSCWFAYCSRHKHFGHVRFVSWDLSVRIESVASLDWYLFNGYTLLYFYLQPSHYLLLPLLFQAAADFAKTRLPEALRQQLLIYERERERDREKDREKADRKERSGLSYPSILEQQILNVDREMLDKLSASYNEAGTCVCLTLVCSSFYTSGSVQRRAADAPMTLRARLLWVVTLAVSTGLLGGGLEPGGWWCVHHLHQDLLIPGARTATNIMYSLGRSQVSPISVPHG